MAQPFDIVGYTYQAENYTCAELLEYLDTDSTETDSEVFLDKLSTVLEIDRSEEWTFDSDTFPKVIFRDMGIF